MHERQTTLTGAILALALLAAAPAQTEEDAATKAQEGEINHWIEYYRKNRQQPQPVVPAPQGAVIEEERGKVKGEKGKVNGESDRTSDGRH